MSDDMEANPTKAAALREQLKELNNRSRWYSGQLWHVPFAYFGLVVLIANQNFRSTGRYDAFIALASSAVLGMFVLWHMRAIRDGEHRAIENLRRVEEDLGFAPTVELKGYTAPFLAAVLTVVIAAATGAVLALC
jgi:hypothetical protein